MINKDTVVKWIQDYFIENGPGAKAVIGISGGKDSTVAAALCVEALGSARVIGVLMPEGYQSDIGDSYRICDWLGIEAIEININGACSSIYREMNYQNLDISKPVVYTNLPARIRMTTLYAVAASVGGRVCNTSNLSEIFVGYSTKWGDGVGDFGPLRNCTVDEVIDLGRQLGLPEDLLVKAPADGLSGKTDEENMGLSYKDISAMALNQPKGIFIDIQNEIMEKHQKNQHKMVNIPSCPRD